MPRLIAFLKRTNHGLTVISIVAMMIMLIVGVYNIAGRALFHRPLLAAIEITELSSVIFVVCGMAYTQLTGSNVIVPVIIEKLPPRARAIFDSCTLFISMAMVAVLAWCGTVFAIETIQKSEITNILAIPTAFFRASWVAGCAFLFIALTSHFIQAVNRAGKR
jgi:TRAP-type C4-dicarboxylate transport system permease small subunit